MLTFSNHEIDLLTGRAVQRKLEITADTRSARQLLNNKTLLAQSDKDGKLDDAILQAVEKELGQVRGEDSIEGVD